MLINSTIQNVGSPTARRSLPDSVMQQISDLLGERYPVKGSVYRLGDVAMLFPMDKLPRTLEDCDWSIAVETDTDTPLAIFPDITPDMGDKLRCYLCSTAKAPMAFYHRKTGTVFLAYMHHDWTIGAWFSLASHDFIHKD